MSASSDCTLPLPPLPFTPPQGNVGTNNQGAGNTGCNLVGSGLVGCIGGDAQAAIIAAAEAVGKANAGIEDLVAQALADGEGPEMVMGRLGGCLEGPGVLLGLVWLRVHGGGCWR